MAKDKGAGFRKADGPGMKPWGLFPQSRRARGGKAVGKVVGLDGLEPTTSVLSGPRSSRLSYRPASRGRQLRPIGNRPKAGSGEWPYYTAPKTARQPPKKTSFSPIQPA